MVTEYDAAATIFGRRFVKRFALCYRTVVWLSACLSVTLVYCGQTVGWIKMKLGMQVGLGPGHIMLDVDPAPPPQRAHPPNSRSISVVAKISVAWNNCFRRIFSCCWRESVKPLQYFCHTLPIPYLLHQCKLPSWRKLYCSDSAVLQSLSRRVQHRLLLLWAVCIVCCRRNCQTTQSENWHGIHLSGLWTCDLRDIISVFLCF